MTPELNDPQSAIVTELTMLTIWDVARILQTTADCVKQLVRSGKLKPTHTLSRGKHRFSREHIRRWIEAGEASSTQDATAEPAGVASA